MRNPAIRLVVVATGLGWMFSSSLGAIPQFARKYDVSCTQCHIIPPKLNAFGEAFVARGYQAPELTPRKTWPLAVWVTARGESRPVTGRGRDEIDPYVNRVEIISGGRLIHPRLSYFVEWRAVSQETRSDGTLRNRSGRFEDLFLNAALTDNLDLTVGQFRQVAQVDISRRLSLSEPLVLSASLPGEGGSTPRERSLRGFSPAGRSPSLRLTWHRDLSGGWRWTTAAALPLPGEFSIPLTSEAEEEASHEIEVDPKGIFVESFVRRDLVSIGAHVFYDDSERYLVQALATGEWRDFHGTVMAGVARSRGRERGRWSVEGEYLPGTRFGFGLRVEDQAGDGSDAAALPYVVWHVPWKFYRLTVTAEQRIQEGQNATLIEVGFVF